MPMLHLVFTLEGSMAGFGDHSVGGQRRAATDIPRSAVLGLIHACMGIDRRDVDAEHPTVQGLSLAIAQRTGGTMMDYHTAFTPKKEKTVLSHRGYQTDLHATVVVWGEEPLLRQVHDALQQPAWTPYLGKRSCPLTAPMRPELKDNAATLRDAFGERSPEDARIHGDDHPAPGLTKGWGNLVPDRPDATHGDRRTFAATLRYTYGGDT